MAAEMARRTFFFGCSKIMASWDVENFEPCGRCIFPIRYGLDERTAGGGVLLLFNVGRAENFRSCGGGGGHMWTPFREYRAFLGRYVVRIGW